MIESEEQAKAYVQDLADDAAMERLERFIALLAEENERQNLIARPSAPEVWRRHVADHRCAQRQPIAARVGLLDPSNLHQRHQPLIHGAFALTGQTCEVDEANRRLLPGDKIEQCKDLQRRTQRLDTLFLFHGNSQNWDPAMVSECSTRNSGQRF